MTSVQGWVKFAASCMKQQRSRSAGARWKAATKTKASDLAEALRERPSSLRAKDGVLADESVRLGEVAREAQPSLMMS